MVARNWNQSMSTATTTPSPYIRGTPHWRNAPVPFRLPLKGWPTEAPPGTQEKLRVIEARHDRGEDLWHPFDAEFDGDVKPLVFYIEYKERTENRRRI